MVWNGSGLKKKVEICQCKSNIPFILWTDFLSASNFPCIILKSLESSQKAQCAFPNLAEDKTSIDQ